LKKQLVKFILNVCFGALAPVVSAYALDFNEPINFKVVNPLSEAASAEKIKALSVKKLEASVKSELINKRFQDLKISHLRNPQQQPDNYLQLENHADEYEPLTQSWLHEVDEFYNERGNRVTENLVQSKENLYKKLMVNSKIDLARKIIKKKLYYEFIKDWSCRGRSPSKNGIVSCLSQTIFNKDAIPDESSSTRDTLGFILDTLNSSLIYSPNVPGASKNYFLFKIQDMVFAEIDKNTLKQGRIVFRLGNGFINKLEPGAEDIKADNDDPKKAKVKKQSVASAADSAGSAKASNNARASEFSNTVTPPPNPPPANTYNDFNDDMDF
jgi:hypothetical protein